MNIMRQAVKAWRHHSLATRKQINALRRGYIKARQILGDKYLLAVPVPRKQAGHADAYVLCVVVTCAVIGAFLP